MKNKCFKILICAVLMLLLASISALTVFAAGDVAGAIEQTWSTAKSQIHTESMVNLNSPHRQYFLPVLFSL